METLEFSGASALVSCADDEERTPVSNAHQAIAIFDASIEGYHDLIAGLHSHIVPYILATHEDGIRALTQILQQHSHSLSVYLVTHGSPGSLRLGNSELSLATLQHYAAALGSWFQPNLELLLYACNVAAGDAGEEFLAKLHQLTGASIAASARRVGNAQQGGTWALDVVAGEMAIALPFTAATMAHYPETFPLAITGINATYDDVPDNATTYTADEVAEIDNPGDGIENYTYNFPVGTENNLIISGFDVGADSFGLVQLVEQVRIERRDNAEVTGTREIFWYERESLDTTSNVLDLKPTEISSLEEALLSPTINRGADNIFANQGDTNVNNIERVDFVETGGISAPASALDDIGFLLLERRGNDPITVAPITAIDVDGTPTAYGTLQTFAPGAWGNSGFNIETAVLNDLGTGNNPGVSATPGAQPISGIFVSFTDLGIGANQRFFGYSVFPGDVETDLVGLTDANPDTNSADGGLDLIASGALFLRNGANVPPTLDLDPSNTTGGANDGNFQATFTSGGVDITAPNATGFDPSNGGADIETLTITVDVFDGTNEILEINGTLLQLTNGASTTATVGSTTFDVAVAVTGGTATVTVTNSATGDISNVDIRQFLRSLSYNNTSPTANTTPRVFSFTANDGVDDGNTVTSTISFNNTTPSLNLDPNNGSGGADDRNFDTTFTTGGNAVDLTANDATAIDPDNGANDVETLTIAVNTPDGADEVLNVGGTPITLTNGTTETVTFGSTTFDIAVTGTGSNATVTVTNDAGGTIPNVDLRTLLRSLTYDNTSTNPDTSDRVFSFEVEDGDATSTTVTSTVSFGNNTPSLNIDPNNTSGGSDDRNFDTTFTAGGNAVDLTANDATVVDPDNGGDDVETLTISVNTPDGADEVLNVGGTPLTLTDGTTETVTFGSTTFDIAVTGTGSNATVTVTNDAGGTIPNTALRTLLRSLTYDNTSTNPDTTDRVFSFVVEDGEGTSNTVTSTVSFGNNTPSLNLDPNNGSGGADDRNFDTTFTTGGSAVDLTANDATVVDPDNGGNDVEALTISVNTPDGADEVLNFGGTPITLTNGTTQTVTFGSTTFDIAVTGTGSNATVTITNDAGGTIPNTALRTLLRSLTYDNTSTNPDTSDRVFSFEVEDGEGTSNTVTSTVSIDPPSNTTSILNLDPNNESGGSDDRNFDTTFTTGGSAVDLTADDATAIDPDNGGNDIETLTISVNTPDGADEVLNVGGTPLTLTNGTTQTVTFGSTTFDIAVTGTGDNATITVTNGAGGTIPNTDLRTLLRSLTYDNTSTNPDTTDRIFTFVTADGESTSSPSTSTVSIIPPSNTTSVLNLDPNNESGGPNNRNFEATFTTGDGAVDITADAATAVDPDNNGADIERLSISVNVPDGPNEILSFGGTDLTLTNGTTTTVTFGSTTFEVAVGVNNGTATVSIDSASGGDIPNTDLRTLLRSLTYSNTSATPDQTDRVFTFIANDGLVNSNTVTSTISIDGGPDDPSSCNCSCSTGLRLAGNGTDNGLEGSPGRDIIRGLVGDDELMGLACPDRLIGAAGNDRLFGGGASDTLDGNIGRDYLSGQNGDDILFGGGERDRLNGGKGQDQLHGEAGSDFLRGKAGSDQIRGGQGKDGMSGGAGRDRMFGGAGNDRMFGGSGRDRMRGNARADRMFGGDDDDRIFGQNGRDLLRGEAGRDIIRGGAGNDWAIGGADNDRIFGGARHDLLIGGRGVDRLSGQRGNDQLRGGRLGDRLSGGSGDDIAAGGKGNDRILGGSGSDTLRGNKGADRVFGSTGRDQLLGGRGDDRIDGGAQNDVIRGHFGADVLLGKGGFDILKGGRRRDRISGGTGKDRLFGGKGNDRIDGASQNDTVRGNKGADVVFGKEGRDSIRGDRGFDRLNGGRDNDTLNGGGAADTLLGKARHDRLEGVAGTDRLYGNNGRDTLVGGGGNDLLVGGADGDILRGGQGADRFGFSGATFAAALRDSLVEDADRILDFDQTEGDRFDINFTRGATAAVPSALFNVGQVVGTNLQAAATQAFRDRNPNQAGNQRLGARQAVLFDWREQSYLLVNNGNGSFNPLQDLVVNVTGIELKAGDANRISLSANDYFV